MRSRSIDRPAVPSSANIDSAAAPSKSPADVFSASAEGKSWFRKAEMIHPHGGLGPGGRVRKRKGQLVVTVEAGGSAAARALLSKLGLQGTVKEQPPVHHGGRRHGS